MGEELLRIENLSTRFFTREGQVNAVSGLDLSIERGEVYGIVGESGSGKSVTARSVIDLIENPGEITEGAIYYRNESLADALRDDVDGAVDGDVVDLRAVPERVRRRLRGFAFSMIFQDPESSFNPSLTVGEQIAEAVEVQRRASATPRLDRSTARGDDYRFRNLLLSPILESQKFISTESRSRAVELLEMVGIPDPVERAEEYPHEYSGGMLQRAMIAQAVAGEPDVLIADEPTTALDVTIQAQILDLLDDLQTETGMTILLITHNLGVIARMCDHVGVMYAGEIVERGTLEDVFDRPVHPYTQGLLGSVPDFERAGGELRPIPGNVPSLLDHEMGDRCYFADRCPKAMNVCLEKPPEFEVEGSDRHRTMCYLAEMSYAEGNPLPEGYFEDASATGDADTTAPDRQEPEPTASRGPGGDVE